MGETTFFGLNWNLPHMKMGKEDTFPSLKRGCKDQLPSTVPLTGMHDRWESTKNQKNHWGFEYSQGFEKQQIQSAMVYSDCDRPPVLIGGFVGSKVHNSRQPYTFPFADLLSGMLKLFNTSEVCLPRRDKSVFASRKNNNLVNEYRKHNLCLSAKPLKSNLEKTTVLSTKQIEVNEPAVLVQPVKFAATKDYFSNCASLAKSSVLQETVKENKDWHVRNLEDSKQSFSNQFCDREENLALDVKMPVQVKDCHWCSPMKFNLLPTKEVGNDSNHQEKLESELEQESLVDLPPSLSGPRDSPSSHTCQRKTQVNELDCIPLERTLVSKDSNIICTEVIQITNNTMPTKTDDESVCYSEMDIEFKIEIEDGMHSDLAKISAKKLNHEKKISKSQNDTSPQRCKSKGQNFKPSCQNPLIAFILNGLSGNSDSEDEDDSNSDCNSTDGSSFECDSSDGGREDAESFAENDFRHLSTNLSDSGTESDWDSSDSESENDYNEVDFQNECPALQELMHYALDEKFLLLCDTYTKCDKEDESECRTEDTTFGENETVNLECECVSQGNNFLVSLAVAEVNARWNSAMKEYSSCPKDRNRMKVSFAPEDNLVSVNCIEGPETLS